MRRLCRKQLAARPQAHVGALELQGMLLPLILKSSIEISCAVCMLHGKSCRVQLHHQC